MAEAEVHQSADRRWVRAGEGDKTVGQGARSRRAARGEAGSTTTWRRGRRRAWRALAAATKANRAVKTGSTLNHGAAVAIRRAMTTAVKTLAWYRCNGRMARLGEARVRRTVR